MFIWGRSLAYKVYFAVGKTTDVVTMSKTSTELDNMGYVNQYGLSRKVGIEGVYITKHLLSTPDSISSIR